VDDLLGTRTDADVIMIGDLFYEPELATRVSRFLEGALADGAMILYADRTTARRPPIGLELLAEHEATPCPGLVEDHIERARVWLAGNPNQTPRRPR
jgi:predicted nicotinamide N-methyase